MAVKEFELSEGNFLSLLKNLISEAEHLQNNPPNYVPKEDLAIKHVLEVLSPFSTENGGPLTVRQIGYAKDRSNLIVEYPGTEKDKILSFVGVHLDVVTADPKDWDFDPFHLSIEGDKLQGRGTTDCLGHVALLTEMFRQLACTRPALQTTVVGVYIANEENSDTLGIGVDALAQHGHLDHLKNGPLFWMDSADKHPCIGTGGIASWNLIAYGKLFHSGLPHQAINPLELGMDALSEIQRRFYADFPPHPNEKEYGFCTSSTLKPTQWNYPQGSINQIPFQCTISGDIRVTPFYDIHSVVNKIQSYVADINENIDSLAHRGPFSKYTLPNEKLRGKVELKFDDMITSGVACDLSSQGYRALHQATQHVLGEAKPFSLTGSLPLISDLQKDGFDVQVMGYGLMSTYHAKNEYCLLSDMKQGFRILANIIHILNSHT